MTVPHFFGYGSLVNRATHTYTDAHPARLSGWRRTWRHTDLRPVAYLTAIPDPQAEIDGLIAHVPGGDWAALDAREDGYDRAPVTPAVRHPRPDPIEIAVYTVPEGKHPRPLREQPILLSYLDVVVQGYLREFGEEGAEAFFRTTSGWSAPIVDDRAAPRYPRAQNLSRGERAFVDDQLRALGAHVLR
ncbi:gamma-glutamylcyclotransferase family protein [Salinihabitans flavidus]|nr:gamma-glutamylcyclotransferase family protein [Salinihabitans flavidus]